MTKQSEAEEAVTPEFLASLAAKFVPDLSLIVLNKPSKPQPD
jgi:hypothetical protein